MSKQKLSSWNGKLPKIGIRPIIDGRRRGIRESLEETTLTLAKSAAALISSKLKYPNGAPVECVVPEFCIGGFAEASRVAELFQQENVGVSLTVTPCWCYGSETMDQDPLLPKAIWGFNGTERPGAVYLAATLAAHTQKGWPAFGIYGRDVQDIGDQKIPADVEEKLLRFAKAGLAAALMKGRAYLSMGGTSMGIAGSIVDHGLFERYFGMRVESKDMTEFLRRIDEKIYDEEEYTKALAWVKQHCQEGPDRNAPEKQRPRAHKDGQWEQVVKMALIMRDMMTGNPRLIEKGFAEEGVGNNAIVSGFQGQRQWTDYQPNGDFMEAILNSSFDWNGPRAPHLVATENDAMNGASMLLGHLLTNSAQVFADVRTYWSPEAVKRVTGHTLTGVAQGGFIHLINSGAAALDGTGQQETDGQPAMKPFWDLSDSEIKKCLDATQWCPSVCEYFRGGGWSSQFATKGGMPVTAVRLNLAYGQGPALQIAEGWTIDLPEKVHQTLDNRTDPSWPTTWFVPRVTGSGVFRDVYSVMNAWGANHCAFSYGHHGADFITLAAILRIPVFMHNVPGEQVFRPSYWNAFGTADSEGADFRACQALGPIYGARK
ncbi:MAG: L-fucose isomerase [Verrucomicrobiales bacterium]|jgi:L-fucose isomerase|nr:L-fucose isomerase [Verrucomicrobiales bacterium]